MDYNTFLKTKEKTFLSSGFEVQEDQLNPLLKPFQKYCVKVALQKGRFALFQDCGLEKTFQQLEWAKQVHNHTKQKVLILAPLAVVEQTKEEAVKFNIHLDCFDITNFDQLKNTDTSIYAGVVLDEAIILKVKVGKLSSLIIETSRNTTYELAYTPIPDVTDYMELGEPSVFLGCMCYLVILAMFFVHLVF